MFCFVFVFDPDRSEKIVLALSEQSEEEEEESQWVFILSCDYMSICLKSRIWELNNYNILNLREAQLFL